MADVVRARPVAGQPWRRKGRHLRLVWSAPAAPPERVVLRLIDCTVEADRTVSGVNLTVVDDGPG